MRKRREPMKPMGTNIRYKHRPESCCGFVPSVHGLGSGARRLRRRGQGGHAAEALEPEGGVPAGRACQGAGNHHQPRPASGRVAVAVRAHGGRASRRGGPRPARGWQQPGPLGPLRGPAAADSPATKRSRAGGRCRRNEDVPGDPRRARLPDGRRGAVLPDRVRGRWRLGGDGQGRDPRVPVAAGFPGRGLATATGMPGLSVSGSHRMPFGKDNPDLLAFDEMRGTCRTARISLAVW